MQCNNQTILKYDIEPRHVKFLERMASQIEKNHQGVVSTSLRFAETLLPYSTNRLVIWNEQEKLQKDIPFKYRFTLDIEKKTGEQRDDYFLSEVEIAISQKLVSGNFAKDIPESIHRSISLFNFATEGFLSGSKVGYYHEPDTREIIIEDILQFNRSRNLEAISEFISGISNRGLDPQNSKCSDPEAYDVEKSKLAEYFSDARISDEDKDSFLISYAGAGHHDLSVIEHCCRCYHRSEPKSHQTIPTTPWGGGATVRAS